MKQVLITLGPGQAYAMHGDRVRPGEAFRLRIEVLRPIGPVVGGAYGLAPWVLVDQEVVKTADQEHGGWLTKEVTEPIDAAAKAKRAERIYAALVDPD